jgi:SAM-dependent methyltransferase
MNMGFADGSGRPGLPPTEAVYQYAAELYRLVATGAELAGRDVVEVGCGRGGGAALVAAQYRPASMIGLDYSPANIAFCQRRHRGARLSFQVGDAEHLPFAGASPDSGGVDAIINIESAHCYPDVERFFAEVFRVLRPGGHLLFADEWWSAQVPALYGYIEQAGLQILSTEDLTAGVIRALEQLRDPVTRLLNQLPEGPAKQRYTRFFTERVGRESAHSYQSGRFRFVRVTARRPQP